MIIVDKFMPRGGTRKGREKQFPKRAIIHAMAEYIEHNGTIYHAIDWLEKVKCSAHIFIAPDGSIIRGRREDQEAIHAAGNNYDTLGAEWLVPGIYSSDTYSDFLTFIKNSYLVEEQFAAGVEYIRDRWVGELGILKYEKHSKVDPAQGKQDPGDGFPWREFLKNIGVII